MSANAKGGADPKTPATYQELVAAFPLRVIRTDEELDKATAFAKSVDVGELTDEAEEYLDTLTLLIQHYEDERFPFSEIAGPELLRCLIEDNGVSQSDVAKGTGLANSTISEILSGKREMSVSHIRALAGYFRVDAGQFLGPAEATAPESPPPPGLPCKPHRDPVGGDRLEAIRDGTRSMADIVTRGTTESGLVIGSSSTGSRPERGPLAMPTHGVPPRHPETADRRRLLVSVGWTMLILVLGLFLPAGTWAWLRGWSFLGVVVAAGVVVTLHLRRTNPDVIAARVNRHEGTKGWDRWVLGLFLPAMASILPLAALDDGRFHWSHVPWWGCGIGYVLLLAGLAGLTWAESVNKFFEPTVRIQADRGHHVIDTGPYALVRHPGYAAAFLVVLGLPLSLGSYWALVPAAISYLLLVVRTALEDRTLQEELPGYKDYAGRVRYRLVPGVW